MFRLYLNPKPCTATAHISLFYCQGTELLNRPITSAPAAGADAEANSRGLKKESTALRSDWGHCAHIYSQKNK